MPNSLDRFFHGFYDVLQFKIRCVLKSIKIFPGVRTIYYCTVYISRYYAVMRVDYEHLKFLEFTYANFGRTPKKVLNS